MGTLYAHRHCWDTEFDNHEVRLSHNPVSSKSYTQVFIVTESALDKVIAEWAKSNWRDDDDFLVEEVLNFANLRSRVSDYVSARHMMGALSEANPSKPFMDAVEYEIEYHWKSLSLELVKEAA
jgi:hypothetical protein